MGVTMRLSRIPSPVLPAALVTAALSSGAVAADVSRSRAEADAMLRKVAVIATHGLASQPQARRTTVTESELNSFLEYHLRNEIPAAVIEPEVSIEEGGRLRGRALVDLDEVKKANAGDPRMSMLALASGRVPVEAAGHRRRRAVHARGNPRERGARANRRVATGGQLLLAQPREPQRHRPGSSVSAAREDSTDRDSSGTSRHRAMTADGLTSGAGAWS
jgi:hypothetical protein